MVGPARPSIGDTRSSMRSSALGRAYLWLCASMRALLISTRASAVSPAKARQMWSSMSAILRTVWDTCRRAGGRAAGGGGMAGG